MWNEKDYDDAIKIWLLRNNRELEKLVKRAHQRCRGMTEREIVQRIDEVSFDAIPEWEYSEMTPGESATGAISFRYKTRLGYTHMQHSVDDLPVFTLIRECSEIMDEFGKNEVIPFPALEADDA